MNPQQMQHAERVATALRDLGRRVDVEYPGRVGVHVTESYAVAVPADLSEDDWTVGIARVGSDAAGWAPYEVEPTVDLPELEGHETDEDICHALEEACARLAPDAPSENPEPEPESADPPEAANEDEGEA